MQAVHKVDDDNQIEAITDWWEEEVKCIYIQETERRSGKEIAFYYFIAE